MWAAHWNNADVSELLIRFGAKTDARSTGGFTPLLLAARAGHIETTRALLAAGAEADDALPDDGPSALALAIINAHYELAAELLDAGADPNVDVQGWTALHQVAYTRSPNIGLANPGALPTGTVSGLALVSRLVEHGANVNARQARERQLKNGLDDRNVLNRVGATPFLLAAKHADAALMRALVAHGADPLLTNEDGTTPLMAAAGVGIWVVGESPGTNAEALDAVQLALELGGDVNAVDDYGYTALHGAAHRGSPAIVQLLAEHGAKLDAKLTKTSPNGNGAKEGWTPLTIAEGVFYANTFKRNFETAALLRELIAEQSQVPRTAWGDPDLQGVWDYWDVYAARATGGIRRKGRAHRRGGRAPRSAGPCRRSGEGPRRASRGESRRVWAAGLDGSRTRHGAHAILTARRSARRQDPAAHRSRSGPNRRGSGNWSTTRQDPGQGHRDRRS